MFYGSVREGVRYVVLICSMTTGEVLAAVDAAYLTAARTGAMSGVATKHMARVAASTVGVIGSGLEAETNLLGVCAVRTITEVQVYSPNQARREAFAERMRALLDIRVEATSNPETAVSGTDIVVVATNTGSSGTIAYRGAWFEEGQHIAAIGSTTPALREIDAPTFIRADRVVIDAAHDQVQEESGDVIAWLGDGGALDDARLLVDVLAGRWSGRNGEEERTLFKSVGTAAQDMIGALHVYNEARRRGIGTEVPDLADPKLFA
jgi:ornithine cyclodeaminase/alanine dehydrogenase-like protein (mu-crystallin family)